MTKKELIQFCFVYERQIRRAVFEKKNGKIQTKTGGSAGHCRISDPTAMTALANLQEIKWVWVEYGKNQRERIQQPEQWLEVVEKTKTHFSGSRHGRIMQLHYEKLKSQTEISKALNMSRTMVNIFLGKVVEYAAGVADGLGIS